MFKPPLLKHPAFDIPFEGTASLWSGLAFLANQAYSLKARVNSAFPSCPQDPSLQIHIQIPRARKPKGTWPSSIAPKDNDPTRNNPKKSRTPSICFFALEEKLRTRCLVKIGSLNKPQPGFQDVIFLSNGNRLSESHGLPTERHQLRGTN